MHILPRYWFFFMAVLAGCSPRPQKITLEEISRVREVNIAYPTAWTANDSATVDRLFTEDAVLIPHHGDSPKEGISAIRQHFWPPNSPPVSVVEYTMDILEIDGEGSLAYSRGRFRLRFTYMGKEYSNGGNFMMVFRRQNDRSWKIARFIWNDPVPQTN